MSERPLSRTSSNTCEGKQYMEPGHHQILLQVKAKAAATKAPYCVCVSLGHRQNIVLSHTCWVRCNIVRVVICPSFLWCKKQLLFNVLTLGQVRFSSFRRIEKQYFIKTAQSTGFIKTDPHCAHNWIPLTKYCNYKF